MTYNYLVPSILSFPGGTGCCLTVPWSQVGAQLQDGRGTVKLTILAIHEGAVIEARERVVSFEDGVPAGGDPGRENLDAFSADPGVEPGFIECGVQAVDGETSFVAKNPLNFYSIYATPGQKSYFSDNAWKYAAPPVIQQIVEYGRFADSYPAVLIDRDQDLGMSVILINPDMKDIICRLYTHDGCKPLRVRIPSMSARRAALVDFLEPSERRWRGQIQLTANNRLVTYIVWHSLREPAAVSDQEHLDAYRGERTHIPVTLQLRRKVGAFVGRKGAMTRRTPQNQLPWWRTRNGGSFSFASAR